MAGSNGERRLNTWLSTGAHYALARIAKRYGITQREVLERFIRAEDDRILATGLR
jgi:DNA-binding Lrp family transcriptional regulator